MQNRRIKEQEARWSVWEDEVADVLELGEKVKASGRYVMFKGDVKSSSLLIDCKYSSRGVYNLTFGVLDNVYKWASNEERIPVLALCLDDNGEYGKPGAEGVCKLAIIPSWFYPELLEKQGEKSYRDRCEPCYSLMDEELRNAKQIGKKFKEAKHPVKFKVGTKHRSFELICMPFGRFIELVNEYELLTKKSVAYLKGEKE